MSEEAKKNTSEEVSASKRKREERKKKLGKEKTKKLITKIIAIAVVVLVAAAIIFGIGRSIYKSSQVIEPSENYSLGLDDNGFVSGVKALNEVSLADYRNMQVSLADVEYSDEDVQKDIDNELDKKKVLNDDSSLTVKDGDTVSIDYVGTQDGVEFDGGNSNGSGYDLTIGSGSFVDDFEQQLIGSAPGDTVIVDVTFPEDYSSEDLAGKDAEFTVNVHGIYELPEFTDEFVQENLSEYASTADEYRQYLKDSNYEKNLRSYLEKAVVDESTVNKYPSKYLKDLQRTQKYQDQESFQYVNNMYMQYYGQGFSDFYEYIGKTAEEYDAGLVETCQTKEKTILVYQAIMEKEGITLTEEDYRNYLIETNGSDDSFASNIETYGLGYNLQNVMHQKAVDIMVENCTVE